MPPKKSGGWGRGRGSNNTSIDITQQGGWGTLLPTPMGGLPLSMGGGMPMFGQQSHGPLNGFMGAANPHPMFSTMLGAPGWKRRRHNDCRANAAVPGSNPARHASSDG